MSESGSIFSHKQGGFHLVVLDRNWALEKISTHEVLAKSLDLPDYSSAKQCALMCARLYVPDFYMIDRAADSKQETLDAVDHKDEPEFREWLHINHQRVVNEFLTTLPGEDKGKYKLEELLGFARRRFDSYLSEGI